MLVDLESSVGNVLIRAALATSYEPYGVEIQEGASELGMEQVLSFVVSQRNSVLTRTLQLAQARARAAAWGVKLGALDFEEGDMLTFVRS